MKLLRILPLAAIALSAATTFVACRNSTSQDNAAEEASETIFTVDSLMADPQALVGDTVTVEGLCSHLCKHGGRKAFILGNDSTLLLRCEATSAIGGAFAPDCAGKRLTVLGIVREDRLDENSIREMEQKHAATEGASDHACSTEAKANGQDSINEFDARMADYRARISRRSAEEGKDYLSFYHLEAIGYFVEQ